MLHCPQLGNASITRLLHADPDLSNLYSFSSAALQHHLKLSQSSMKKFIREFQSIDIKSLIHHYQSNQISAITIMDERYPPLLREIHQPPLLLFIIGDHTLLKTHSVAFVGARSADSYGKKAIARLIKPLIDRQVTIVSGLAKGIDAMAHQQAIEMGGRTIAVLGGGFYHLYPSENKHLAEIIKKDHLLVSEYPPIWRPQKWYFPMRNRIISGLSKGTVIVQAKTRSGSLITADFALEEGREVFSVPGPIGSPLSEGSNWLIQQGAKLVTTGEDILEELLLI